MMSNSIQTFVTVLCAGAAVLALWILVRLPDRGARDLRGALLHVALSIALGYAVAPAIRAIAAVGIPAPAYVGTFAIALPALTYMFLAAAWLLRVMRDMLHGARY